MLNVAELLAVIQDKITTCPKPTGTSCDSNRESLQPHTPPPPQPPPLHNPLARTHHHHHRPQTATAHGSAFLPLLLLLRLAAPVHCQSQTEAALKAQIKGDVASIKANVFSFWQQHGLDSDFGGFHGTLTRAGAATSPTTKGIIQQARHMFAFSLFHQAGYSAGSPTPQQMAQSAYGFVTQHMRDPDSGLWYTSVSREGRPADTNKSMYGQWFAIYGLRWVKDLGGGWTTLGKGAGCLGTGRGTFLGA